MRRDIDPDVFYRNAVTVAGRIGVIAPKVLALVALVEQQPDLLWRLAPGLRAFGHSGPLARQLHASGCPAPRVLHIG